MRHAIWLCASLSIGGLFVPAVAYGQGLGSGADFQEVISALNENNMSAEEIRTAASYNRVEVVDLSAIAQGAKLQVLQETLRETEDEWAEVQTAIEANELFEEELNRRSVDISRVIAVTMDDGGVVTFYLR